MTDVGNLQQEKPRHWIEHPVSLKWFRTLLSQMPVFPRRARMVHKPSSAILKIAADTVAPQRHPIKRYIVQIVDFLAWPFVLYDYLRRVPPLIVQAAADISSKKTDSEKFRAWKYCLKNGTLPSDYYNYILFMPENGEKIDQYIFLHEAMRLYERLFTLADPSELAAVSDKQQFAARCRANNLAVAEELAVAEAGDIEFITPLDDPAWRGDLVMKPNGGSLGIGLYVWRRQDDGRYAGVLGETYSISEIIDYVKTLSLRAKILIQRRICNDAETAKFSSGGLATMRIVTGRRRGGEPIVLAAAIKLPVGSNLVDNYAKGNVLAQIDIDRGVMSQARYYANHLYPMDIHPDSGEPITGQAVPQLDAAKALAVSAHAMFPSLVIMAFDIAATPAGPIIVEGNVRGNLEMIQYPDAPPLLSTAFTPIVMSHFE